MNLRPNRPQDPEITLTPLIDVVFLLLIFFMVSTSFVQEAELEITLPEAGQEPRPAEERQQVVLAIDAQGRYVVDGRQVDGTRADALKTALLAAMGTRKDLPLVLRADTDTPHGAVIRALDAAGRLGLERISFATDFPGPEPAQAP